MYVCVCRAVTDGQIQKAIGEGACTRRELVECFGVGRVCGKCNDDVKALLAQAARGRPEGYPTPVRASTPPPWPRASQNLSLVTGISP
jgi:bacterioferritin-associated ferredoxin